MFIWLSGCMVIWFSFLLARQTTRYYRDYRLRIDDLNRDSLGRSDRSPPPGHTHSVTSLANRHRNFPAGQPCKMCPAGFLFETRKKIPHPMRAGGHANNSICERYLTPQRNQNPDAADCMLCGRLSQESLVSCLGSQQPSPANPWHCNSRLLAKRHSRRLRHSHHG